MITLKPLVTEKTLALQSSGKYTFYVPLTATKSQIAASFKAVFGHQPLQVNLIRLKGKVKTDWKKRLPIVKSDHKKAIITIDKTKKIELLNLKQK